MKKNETLELGSFEYWKDLIHLVRSGKITDGELYSKIKEVYGERVFMPCLGDSYVLLSCIFTLNALIK